MLREIQHAIRAFRKRPGFTVIVLLTLALGIGANATIFTLVNAFLIRPLPYRDAGRLVALIDVQPQETLTPASFPEFDDWRSNNTVFQSMTAWFPRPANLTNAGEPRRIRMMQVARDYFATFGIEPIAGRVFTADEHKPGSGGTTLISSTLWQSQFGGALDVLGKTLIVSGKQYVVIGVLPVEPSRVGTRLETDIWTPLERDPPFDGRGTHYLSVTARLKQGVTMEQARERLAILAKEFAAKNHSNHGIRTEPLQEQMFGVFRPTLLVLLAAAGLLLLIAAVNVANLLLARATSRSREFAIRVAIGASRWDLIRQTMVESTVLAIAGGIAGLVLSLAASSLLAAVWPAGVPKPPTFDPDWRVFAFLAAASLLTALLFGLAPAIQASMASLNEALKQGWGHLSAGGRGPMRNALVVAEIAVACVLLIGAGLLLKSFAGLMSLDPGFHAENVLTMSLSLPAAKYKEPSQREAFFDLALSRMKTLPGAIAAGAITDLPLGGGNVNGDIEIVGRTFPKDRAPVTDKIVVTPEYFRAIGMRLLRGRWFTELDGTKGHAAVIINDAMARKFWPNDNPIGKQIKIQYSLSDVQEIVGVVADVKSSDLADAPTYQTYLPFHDLPGVSMTLVVRTTADPLRIVPEVRQIIRAIDPEQPLAAIKTMQEVVSDSLGTRKMSTGIVGTFAFFALALASIGIYGVVSYWVSQRTREIGIRNALGARQLDIFEMVLSRGMLLVGFGVVAGLVGSFALTRYLSSLLYGVSTHDWMTMAGVPIILTLVALVACCVPARRASRVDPVVALRFE